MFPIVQKWEFISDGAQLQRGKRGKNGGQAKETSEIAASVSQGPGMARRDAEFQHKCQWHCWDQRNEVCLPD